MAKKKSIKDSFSSMQIWSSKAQSLWSKAKEKMKTPESTGGKEVPLPEENRSVVFLDISSWTVAKATIACLLVLLTAFILFMIRDKLLIVFLALFISIVMDWNVRWLERMRVPRPVAVLLLYLLFFSIALFLLLSLIPIVAAQIQDMARYINSSADAFLLDPRVDLPFLSMDMNERLSVVLQSALESMGIKDRASALLQFGQSLSGVTQSSIGLAVQIAGSVFNFVVTLILIMVMGFFIQLERERIIDFTRSLLPRSYRSYFDTKTDAIYLKISQWFRGQLFLSFSIGVLVFIALTILGMPYALTLAMLAAFTEFIPYAGPIIAALPSVFIALSQFGFVWAAVVAVVYYVVQICENNLLVPLIMKHAVGLSPIAIIFGMLVGVSFPNTVHPVVGIILAVPTTAIITIFVQDFSAMRKRK
ncbi:MAG: AI-2E family transporter [Candidatus Peribacteraceae bacterium]